MRSKSDPHNIWDRNIWIALKFIDESYWNGDLLKALFPLANPTCKNRPFSEHTKIKTQITLQKRIKKVAKASKLPCFSKDVRFVQVQVALQQFDSPQKIIIVITTIITSTIPLQYSNFLSLQWWENFKLGFLNSFKVHVSWNIILQNFIAWYIMISPTEP